ncbi:MULTISPECIES: UDP-glucose/GDP-mannose dehydrogenase family protein [unclassified Isoptericola]|uniref:UDP-glucose dehydrogenase family protein n=1 Tax=unclassified Isoptericola TaxID=2623355 RepID=UPI002712CBD2|nr:MULTISPECIES: UDP-glucose/GDP-mannose dehydrogenase family protein [unclassified Isoptericola]MDO8144110.1 UDP-glucose/GDP-mannose dehydrogenase family protein [Isoptericola sp. 178]MDO8152686.1 UDP-glucose/GDP-mannose dehydrogenase family protein [Isoptericola sp. b408]
MRVSVVGLGYLGAVHAASMASLGHEVVGVDVDAARVESLALGKSPFFEPGFDELLARAVGAGRLSVSADVAAVAGARVHFVCVGTPQAAGSGAADLSFVEAAVSSLVPHLAVGDVVVGKSTVPVGTATGLAARVEAVGATLVWNPEFLREGFAVADTLHPDRIVYGVPEGEVGRRAAALLDEVYATPLAEGTPQVVTDYATAELVKVAANSFLATKISFINAMAELCEVAGGDVTRLADAIGHDQRIGRRFLNAGLGFGGGCLPKDIRAFMARADELGAGEAVAFLGEVDAINTRRRARMVELAVEVLGGDVAGARVAVLGAAFKPDSDDVRDSPALDVAARLDGLGAHVVVHDPQAIDNARRKEPSLAYERDLEAALTGADVVLVLTEWRHYRDLDPARAAGLVARPQVLDGRGALDRDAWQAAGWTYRALGRP